MTMILKMLILVPFFIFCQVNGYRISDLTITDGGKLELGQDAVFSFKAEGGWFMCIYYRYHPLRDDHDFCSYMCQSNGVSQLKCNPESFGDHLLYTGTDPNECTVTVQNLTIEDSTPWAVRLASDIAPTWFNITVSKSLKP